MLNLQEPQKIILGHKEVHKRKRGVLQPCNSTDDAYYISVLDSLESLLNDEFVLEQVEWEICFSDISNQPADNNLISTIRLYSHNLHYTFYQGWFE